MKQTRARHFVMLETFPLVKIIISVQFLGSDCIIRPRLKARACDCWRCHSRHLNLKWLLAFEQVTWSFRALRPDAFLSPTDRVASNPNLSPCTTNWQREIVSKLIIPPFYVSQHLIEICTYPLPDDDVVEHGASAEDDSHADHYTCSDGRSRWELDDGVQNDIWSGRQSKRNGLY